MTKILITGSAGFLGANLIRYILFTNKNIDVIGIDRLNSISTIHNVYMNKSSEFHLADIRDQDIVNKIFEISKPDFVIHMASENQRQILPFDDSTVDMLNNNVSGFNNIITACSDHNIKKLIYISTSSVYNSEDKIKKTENEQTYPSNEYIVSKIYCENLINVFAKTRNLNYNIVRTTEVFGPRQHRGIISNMFLDVKGNGKIQLNNKGNIIRDLLYVEDFCSAIILILLNGANNEIYNLSAGVDFTDLEIASLIIEQLKEGKIEFINKDIPDPYIELDTTKIKNLGWKPFRKFKERLKQTITWNTNNMWLFN